MNTASSSLFFTYLIIGITAVLFSVGLCGQFDNNKDNLLTAEYLIPDVLSNLIKNNKASTKVIPTSANWYGVTYKEDTPGVKRAIQNLVDNHEYNDNLWD